MNPRYLTKQELDCIDRAKTVEDVAKTVVDIADQRKARHQAHPAEAYEIFVGRLSSASPREFLEFLRARLTK